MTNRLSILLRLVSAAAVVCFGTQSVLASSFGFSVNINFGAQTPIGGSAGRFGDTVWNSTRDNAGRLPINIDLYGDTVQSPATISWSGSGIGTAQGILRGTPANEVALMQSYLESPSEIVLRDLDQIIPGREIDDLVYSLILYTYGGQEGKEGQYEVEGRRPQNHIDPGTFDGTYFAGERGNLVIFPNLRLPDLSIRTDGFGPVNAISLVYCLPGDFDGDGKVDGGDLEKLNGAVKGGETDPSFDVNFDGTVDHNDVMSWIKCSKGTCIGDVNLDGSFDSSDLVQLFQAGIYETGGEATWTTGDWNGDCIFDSGDLLLAFQEGCYESTKQFATFLQSTTGSGGDWNLHSESATLTVPEPQGAVPWLVAACVLTRWRRA